MYEKGHKPYGTGGTRKGAGRNPDWLKVHCAEIVNKYHLADFLGEVAYSAKYEMRDRLKCIEILLERGFGKPIQPIGVDPGNNRVIVEFK